MSHCTCAESGEFPSTVAKNSKRLITTISSNRTFFNSVAKRPLTRNPHALGKPIRFFGIDLDRKIPTGAAFSLHGFTKVFGYCPTARKKGGFALERLKWLNTCL
jgi:hypothetical protein